MSFTTNFKTELAKKSFNGNIVLQIGTTYFSQHAVESGLSVDTDKQGVIINVSNNATSIDTRRVKTPISSIGFSLLDKNSIISSFLGSSDNQLMNETVKFYFGFIKTGSGNFDFSDYALLSTAQISTIQKIENGYRFNANEANNLLQSALLNTSNSLDGSINDTVTTITLTDATNFPSSGTVKINDEFIDYAGKSGNDLTGCVRGQLSSTASEHDDDDEVFLVTKKEAHSMDIALDIILNDLGISASLVDSASFTDLRDGQFSGETDFTLYIYNVEDALEFLQENIFIATNTRLIIANGIIKLALLDQAPIEATKEIDESTIRNTPNMTIRSEKITNKIKVRWFYNEGLRKYTRVNEYSDSDSIALYGESRTLTLNFKGVTDESIVADRANRLLSRLSTPLTEISLTTHFSNLEIEPGDNVLLTNRFLPQQGGSLGFGDVVEVMNVAPKGYASDGPINYKLQFTSYTGIRLGLISPSPALTLTITDQKTFEVPDGSCYRVGYKLKLWDNVNKVYFSDPVNTIASISGNVITMENDFTTTLGANVSLYFADYDESSDEQKARYAYIAPDTTVFVSDNSKAYQIII